MKQSVIDAWHAFSEPLEGRVNHMYLDILGLVTTGVGNLIDSLQSATALPWRFPDGSLAERPAIEAQWSALKAAPSLAQRHYKYAKDFLELRFRHALVLLDEDIEKLVAQKLRSNEAELLKHFPGWHDWPADAQLATASMAWAMGPAFPLKFPNFSRIMNAGDFATAGTPVPITGVAPRGGAPCDIRATNNPGVVPRNELNRAHLVAASSDLAREFPEVLHGPCTLDALRSGWRQAPPIQRPQPPEVA